MKVIAEMQNSEGETITMPWAGSALPTDEVGAMLAVAQLFQHAKDDSPWQPNITRIIIELP